MADDYRILVVDDEQEFVEALASLIRENDYEVDIALSAYSALDMISADGYDLLVADLNLPGMDGIELIRRVQESKPAIKAIIVTGYPSTGTRDEAIRLHTVDYIVKPFSMDRFFSAVAKARNGSQAVNNM